LPRSVADRRLSHEQGQAAEASVALRLEGDGWRVLARNWRRPAGELDLVVQRGGQVRFVEVKARAEGDPSALDAVDREKQRRLTGAAEAFLAEHDGPWEEAAFLVAEVVLGEGGWEISLLDDAFDAV
jgi:putative endonuclease